MPTVETPVSPQAVYTARPTIQVDEQSYPLVNELLIAMDMVEREGGLSALELRLVNVASDDRGNADFAFEDDRTLTLGGRLKVYAGDEHSPTEIFRGVITGLEAVFPRDSAPELIVLAEDMFQQARMERRTATYDDVSIADIAEQIAQNLGLQPTIDGFTDQIGTHVQFNESDLAFLRRLLHQYDGDLQVVGTEIHVAPRSQVQRGTVTLELHGQLREARMLADLAHQVTAVSITGWDVTQGARIQVSSRGANTGPGSGMQGGGILERAIGSRQHHVQHINVTNDTEAQALADSIYDDRARRFVTVEAVADGNPAIRVGTHVDIRGVGRFENTYYVTYARHTYTDTGGYVTEIEGECAFWGGG
jgi:phage protein D